MSINQAKPKTTNMNYTEDITKILTNSQKIAANHSASYVQPEDIFLSLLTHENQLVNQIFSNLNISKHELTAFLNSKISPQTKTCLPPACRRGRTGRLKTKSKYQLSYAPSVKAFFDQAREQSANLKDTATGAEHLLLAFAKKGKDDIAETFKNFKLDYKKLLEELKKLIQSSRTPFLDQYGNDLTAKAAINKLDPVIGRFDEIDRVIQILSRRQKNNAVLYGEAGVGKTAIVEGIAQKIAKNEIPKNLQGKKIIELSMHSIIAGAQHRGEYEERLKNILEETKNSRNIILFIDEIHTIVGTETNNEAANILKPALARGEIQTIGATTVSEYRKYFEKDAALERRFQPVYIKEPNEEECFLILQGLKEKYEKFHNLQIKDEVLMEAVKLSKRYITTRFLPDKAIDLLDEACTNQRLPKISNIQKIEHLKKLKEFYEKQNLTEKITKIEEQIAALKEIKEKSAEDLTTESLQEVTTRTTGIPLTHLKQSENEKFMQTEEILKQKIIGQELAIGAISSAILRNRAGLKAKSRPIGSFIFMGPTGVGKTELAKVLSEHLFGSKDKIVRFDMSEFSEKHASAKLIGAPPGYIGYEEGGQLTEKIRTHPYSIVLFDEIEKAAPDVFNLLLQILEDGRLTDNQGHTVDFSNTIVICTSNIGGEKLDPQKIKNTPWRERQKILIPEIKKFLKPELINRFDDIIYFDPLDQAELLKIVDLLMENVKNALKEKGIELNLTEKAKKKLVELGFDPNFGARPLRYTIQREIETPLAKALLQKKFKKGDKIKCDFDGEKFVFGE